MIFTIVEILLIWVLLIYTLIQLVSIMRNRIYQKRWDEEKTNRVIMNPAITKAELCVLYVQFCETFDCLVEF